MFNEREKIDAGMLIMLVGMLAVISIIIAVWLLGTGSVQLV